MPSPRVIDLGEDSSESEGVGGFFTKLAESIKSKQKQDFIGNIYKDYLEAENEEGAFKEAVKNVQTSNKLSPSERLQEFENLKQVESQLRENRKNLNTQLKEKEKTEKEANESYEILVAGGKEPEEAKRLSKSLSPASAKSLVKPATTKGDKFEETLASEGAKQIPKLEESIAVGNDALININRIEELSKKYLKGGPGYVRAAFSTEAATEVKNLSVTNLESIIKLFNPAGTLPTAKLNWIRDTFAINPSDNLSTIQGKINSQRIITKQALDRAKERKKLLKQYKGNIPEDVELNFDKETIQITDAMNDTLNPEKEKKQTPKGKVRVKNKKTGETGSVTPYEGMGIKYDILK